jgi:hypothetical protein
MPQLGETRGCGERRRFHRHAKALLQPEESQILHTETAGSFGICQECLVERAQFRLTNEVEGPLQHHLLAAPSTRSCEFRIMQPESHAKVGGVRVG